jgi:hypothetical protein
MAAVANTLSIYLKYVFIQNINLLTYATHESNNGLISPYDPLSSLSSSV